MKKRKTCAGVFSLTESHDLGKASPIYALHAEAAGLAEPVSHLLTAFLK